VKERGRSLYTRSTCSLGIQGVNISRIVDCNLPLERHEYFSLFFWNADSASSDFVSLLNIIKHQWYLISKSRKKKREAIMLREDRRIREGVYILQERWLIEMWPTSADHIENLKSERHRA
jgi:hypothetical protein